MISIKAEGQIYEGFAAAEIYNTLNAVSGSFYLRYSANKDLFSSMKIKKGSEIQIFTNNELRLTGFIDGIEKVISSNGNQFHISGRSKTADLVDCSLISDPGEFSNQTLLDLIKKFIAPFGLSVKSEIGNGGLFEKWSISPGETVWENLEKATRIKGLLLTGDETGNLKLMLPGSDQEETQLIENQNIIEASHVQDNSSRYSEYIVKGQAPGSLTDSMGSALDTSITRYRPLLILSEAPVNTSGARKRAEWENIIRAMRGDDLTIKVNDWLTSPKGSVWNINKRTKVICPTLELNEEFLITGVKLVQEENSFFRTEMELERIDSFSASKTVNQKAQR